MEWLIASLPPQFERGHCEIARSMVGWSVEALAFRSAVSPGAIKRLEGGAELLPVTMQALAFAFETEGLISSLETNRCVEKIVGGQRQTPVLVMTTILLNEVPDQAAKWLINLRNSPPHFVTVSGDGVLEAESRFR